MWKYSTVLVLLGVALCGCERTSDDEAAIPELPYTFADGFEAVDNDFDALFPADNSRWTNLQVVNPEGATNEIGLSSSEVSEGGTALRILSQPSDGILSKTNIEKGGFFAPVGSRVTIKADFYIDSREPLRDLFLIDLECCSCWDESVPDNQCPGIRLKFGEGNLLSIERGKILAPTLTPTGFSFPTGAWVNVQWQMRLSPEDGGMNRLVINGQEVIAATGKNLPNATDFRDAFAAEGVTFELREPLGYERMQIGATANPTANSFLLYVDNVRLLVE